VAVGEGHCWRAANSAARMLSVTRPDSTCNYLVGSCQWGDLTPAEASRSLDLCATEVMPHCVESPVQASADA
jgi:hypothetical protein